MPERFTVTPYIHRWMGALAQHRPVFHSEADFQFALSQVMSRDDVERVRLERRMQLNGHPVMRLDITAYVDGNPVALELKYPKDAYTATIPTEGHDEDFNLAAGEPGLVYIWKDVERVEQLVESGDFTGGATITLTNFKLWRQTARRSQVDDFLLFEGRRVAASSTLEVAAGTTWAPDGIKTSLASAYTCSWHPYSAPEGTEFRYSVLEPAGRLG